ncbi:MAG TPA: hypothetical protein VGM51_15135 [Armatimonadota bacterium]|jgi:hypothetical protein
MRYAALLAMVLLLGAETRGAVRFDPSGNTLVNGRPFFPIGLYTYSLDPTVFADMKRLGFNTAILLTEHHSPAQLDEVAAHGLMAICPTTDRWFPAVKGHPALLAWYLDDEPEGHGQSPVSERERYLAVKTADPDHPIGLCHYLWEAIEKYRDACDLTMTDVYPITAARDVPITHVGKFMDEARRVHGETWPLWPYVQVFGGPATEGGKWAQPTPAEVRCMVYIELIHRANGIMYFPYWPKAPQTWESLGPINREIGALAPWLTADGRELTVTVSPPTAQVRARQTRNGTLVTLVNTSAAVAGATVTVRGLAATSLSSMFSRRVVKVNGGTFRLSLAPYETLALKTGESPDTTAKRASGASKASP